MGHPITLSGLSAINPTRAFLDQLDTPQRSTKHLRSFRNWFKTNKKEPEAVSFRLKSVSHNAHYLKRPGIKRVAFQNHSITIPFDALCSSASLCTRTTYRILLETPPTGQSDAILLDRTPSGPCLDAQPLSVAVDNEDPECCEKANNWVRRIRRDSFGYVPPPTDEEDESTLEEAKRWTSKLRRDSLTHVPFFSTIEEAESPGPLQGTKRKHDFRSHYHVTFQLPADTGDTKSFELGNHWPSIARGRSVSRLHAAAPRVASAHSKCRSQSRGRTSRRRGRTSLRRGSSVFSGRLALRLGNNFKPKFEFVLDPAEKNTLQVPPRDDASSIYSRSSRSSSMIEAAGYARLYDELDFLEQKARRAYDSSPTPPIRSRDTTGDDDTIPLLALNGEALDLVGQPIIPTPPSKLTPTSPAHEMSAQEQAIMSLELDSALRKVAAKKSEASPPETPSLASSSSVTDEEDEFAGLEECNDGGECTRTKQCFHCFRERFRMNEAFENGDDEGSFFKV